MNIKKYIPVFLSLLIMLNCYPQYQSERKRMAVEIENSLKKELVDIWYPASVDTLYGGFLSSFSFDFKPFGEQDKMVVTQSRHTWVNARASMFYNDRKYLDNAKYGFEFLKNHMWDSVYGGFDTFVDRTGILKGRGPVYKTAYGNAFAIYALSAYYKASGNEEALDLAKKTFYWLEKNSHDSVYKGYYQYLYKDGTKIKREQETVSDELGLKDQNSSIHLLEAFTELYQVWPDELLRERLSEMLFLIRDVIVCPKGYLVLFFQPDWTPVSFKFENISDKLLKKRIQLDHISFGHDVETAYLMIEASEILGLKDDTVTLSISKKMLDHSLNNGWDNVNGGFYDMGYYFNDDKVTIVKDTKNWWAQAEGLNTLLLMSDYFPEDELKYFEKFEKQWSYINKYLIDHEHGDWYQGGLDKEPESKNGPKGHIWKGCYHQYRSLENCVKRLNH